MLGVCDACFHWLSWINDHQSLLFGALPLSLSLSCRSLASWIFASQFLSLIRALWSFAIQPLFWVAVHWHHGLWHHSSFHKLCSLKLCYSASLRVAVYWLISLYLHLNGLYLHDDHWSLLLHWVFQTLSFTAMTFMTADMIEEHHLKKVHVYEMKVS